MMSQLERRDSGSTECTVVEVDDLEWEQCALGGFIRKPSRAESDYDRVFHQELADMDAKLRVAQWHASRLETKLTMAKRQREYRRDDPAVDIYVQLAQLAGKLSECSGTASAPAEASAAVGEPARQRKVVILFGPPGAGKELQLARLVDHLQVPQLNIAGLLRAAAAADSELGQQLRDEGRASDALSLAVLGERIREDDCADGFILDGFPNTPAQAEHLESLLSSASARVEHLLVLEVKDS